MVEIAENLVCMQEYKNLSLVWEADRKIRPKVNVLHQDDLAMPNSDPEGRILLSAANYHVRLFILHTFWSPAFDFNVGGAIYE